MRKGFTLLELMIVIIIVGVLATLGIMQYQSTIEKSRGAEARSTISTLRSACAAIYLQNQATLGCTTGALAINMVSNAIVQGQIPGSDCWTTNYFRYVIPGGRGGVVAPGGTIDFQAVRCAAGGKTPNNAAADGAADGSHWVNLHINYADGTDTWTTGGGY